MATYIKHTCTSPNISSTNTGTITKWLYGIIVELLGDDIETIDVNTDTTDKYNVYFKLIGCDDIVFNLYNSSSSLYTKVLGKDSKGSVTISDETYSAIASSGMTSAINSNRIYDIYVIREPDTWAQVLVRYDSSYSSCGWTKIVEMCSGEEISVALSTSNVAPTYVHKCSDGSILQYSASTTIGDHNNGYIRLSPIYYSGYNFVGFLTNPALVYRCVNNGNTLNILSCTEFTVAGIKFLSLGSGYAIRLDD